MENNSDIISATIGDFGRWQLIISILMGLLKISVGWFQLSVLVLAPVQDFWCKSDENNETLFKNETNLNKCYFETNSGTSVPCSDFEYDTSVFTSTIISEWDLVCSKAYYVEFTQMTFMSGTLLGFMIFGAIADKYGRRIPLTIAVLIQGVSCFVSSFSPNFFIFNAARFVLAIANGGVSVISIVMCIEIVGGKWRTIIPILYQAIFGIGTMIVILLSYFFRKWRHVQIILSILSSALVLCNWFVPESPRWLLVTNQKEKAMDLLKEVAKFNKMEWNEAYELQEMVSESESDNDIIVTKNIQNEKSFRIIFRNKKLFIRIALLCIKWFGYGVVIFGYLQYIGTLSNNMFTMIIISNLSMIPGVLINLVMAKYVGRKKTMIIFEILVGLFFLLMLAFPKGTYPYDWPRVLLSSLAVLSISIFMPVMALYVSEVFPTVIRNSCVGFVFTAHKLGSILGPLVVSMGRISWFLPLTFLGVTTLLLTLTLIPLPETKNKNISDTIDDD